MGRRAESFPQAVAPLEHVVPYGYCIDVVQGQVPPAHSVDVLPYALFEGTPDHRSWPRGEGTHGRGFRESTPYAGAHPRAVMAAGVVDGVVRHPS